MKTNLHLPKTPFCPDFGNFQRAKQHKEQKIEVIDFLEETESGKYVISLQSSMFSNCQPEVSIEDGNVIMLVKEEGCVENTYVSDWQNDFSEQQVKTRSFRLNLPDDDYYIVHHYRLPESSLLRIVLGRSGYN